MTAECLGFIDEQLTKAGLQYEFGEWTDTTIPSTYWVGEYMDNGSANEDGQHESVFILTGTTTDSWLFLELEKQKIESLFPSVVETVHQLSNGSRLAVYMSTSLIIPTDTMDLKRIQINLTIKEWMVR